MKRILPQFDSESGASLVEVVVASAILLGSLGSAHAYIGQATKAVKGRTAVSENSSLETTLTSVIRSILESEARTDPCLHSTNLDAEISKREGDASASVTLSKFEAKKVEALKEFLGSALNQQWSKAIDFCRSTNSNNGCLLLDVPTKKGQERSGIALAVIQQTSFDFATNKVINRSSCDNSKILTEESEGAGKGLKANYLFLTATRVGDKNAKNIVLRKFAGEIMQTSSRSIVVAGSSEFDPKRSPSCTYSFCATSLPPDPGKDYRAWSMFPRGASYYASFCNKCERAQDYK